MKKAKRNRSNVVKGASSGFFISLIIHAAMFFLAGLLVVFTITKKEEKKFTPPTLVDRPKMKLKRLQMKVQKSAPPKQVTHIVSKVKQVGLPNIELPEMSGISEGLVSGIGGFEILPELETANILGSSQTIGNDFEGVFYDLKRDRRGGIFPMDQEQFRQVLREFVRDGWKKSELARYYRAPKKLYTTHFIVPPIPAPMAPDVFGAPETESYWFFVHYQGKLVYKEDLRFRFWGIGNAYIFVRVNRKNVLVNCWWNLHGEYFDWWQTSNADSGKFFLADQTLYVGDWIELKAGEPVEMEVLFGEWNGGNMSAGLLVEVEGVDYPQTRQGGPLLPAFKTEEFSLDMLEAVYKFLPEDECTLTNGPVFRDY